MTRPARRQADAGTRAILAAEAEGDEPAALAVGVYLHRLRASAADMVAALDGLDVLVFTGAAKADAEISPPCALVRALVITAREDLEVVRQVKQVLERP